LAAIAPIRAFFISKGQVIKRNAQGKRNFPVASVFADFKKREWWGVVISLRTIACTFLKKKVLAELTGRQSIR
jgi:hypothetical protein